jgi:hypothetical protein
MNQVNQRDSSINRKVKSTLLLCLLFQLLGLQPIMDIKNNNPINSALKCAEKGWPVLPVHTVPNGRCSCGNPECLDAGKHPRIKGWPQNASTDAETIRAWFRQWPNTNFGILTGPRSGLVVLDIDGAVGLTEIEKLGLPPTIVVRTGKESGMHLYFKAPDFEVVADPHLTELP